MASAGPGRADGGDAEGLVRRDGEDERRDRGADRVISIYPIATLEKQLLK
jgi:hypothetical protein